MNTTSPKTVVDYLNEVNYAYNDPYIPTEFATEFVNFIKLVNGTEGEEHLTPVVHYKMLDQVPGMTKNILNMCSRGLAKTTVMGEYLFLYLAVFGSIPGFGKVDLALYVSDSMENGVKNMRKNLEYRWENSEFLQQYVPKTKFTDARWEFTNVDGKTFIVKGYGAKTGVRGSKEMGQRPTLAVLDDLVSDEDARSATVIESIEATIYKAIRYALHPSKHKIIWSGTPFNARDPLYKAVESGAWKVNVYPVCESFPCSREEFKGAWPDRFTYEYVEEMYETSVRSGKLDTFNQELMLRVMSDDDRLIQDHDLAWYYRKDLLKNRSVYNFYITTDFATSEKTSADFSVISVWAYDYNGNWFWVDGIVKKQLMDENLEDLFRLVQMYDPQEVGIEISGQQGGFVPWIRGEMSSRNCFFNLATDNNGGKPGIRPNTNKMQRFNIMVPMFKANKIFFPDEMKETPQLKEALDELTLASAKEFKSKHDDFIDTISMLSSMNAWKPSQQITQFKNDEDETDIWGWDEDGDDEGSMSSYLV
jgi:predicted phage terminase large subunit-like protein